MCLRFEHFFASRFTSLGDGDEGRVLARNRRASAGERNKRNG